MQSENASPTRLRCATARQAGRRLQLLAFECQHLSPAVIAARWASDVRRNGTSALGALVQLRGMPAVRCFAHA